MPEIMDEHTAKMNEHIANQIQAAMEMKYPVDKKPVQEDENPTVEVEDKDESPVEETKEKDKKEGKLFTQEEVTAIVSQRLARIKTSAIDQKVSEKVAEFEEEKKALLAEVEQYKKEAETASHNFEVLKLANETGISSTTLKAVNLRGSALKSFAEQLLIDQENWGKQNKNDVLEKFVKKSSGEAGTDWRKEMAEKMKGSSK